MNVETGQTPGQAPLHDVKGYSISEAASLLNASPRTVRRWVKTGLLQAMTTTGKYGTEYRIVDLPPDLVDQGHSKPPTPKLDVAMLLQRISQLEREAGYWEGKYHELDDRMKLLTAPKPSWWHRLGQFALKIRTRRAI